MCSHFVSFCPWHKYDTRRWMLRRPVNAGCYPFEKSNELKGCSLIGILSLT